MAEKRCSWPPSDFWNTTGLVVGEYSGRDFQAHPTAAVQDACLKVGRRIWEVSAADASAKRAARARVLAVRTVRAADQLQDLAFLLRDTFDALRRDAMESLADEKQFLQAKQSVGDRIREQASNRQDQASLAGVETELRALEAALVGIVQAIPFPRESRDGFLDAQALLKDSMLGLLPELVDVLQRGDIGGGLSIVKRLQGRLTPEDVAQEVARLFEAKLRELQESYTNWWRMHSKNVNSSLTRFQRALSKAGTRAALRELQESSGDTNEEQA